VNEAHLQAVFWLKCGRMMSTALYMYFLLMWSVECVQTTNILCLWATTTV